VPGSCEPGLITFENDQATEFHKKFYNSPLLPEFLSLYEQFVKKEIVAMFPKEVRIIYQKKPTFRVHLPNNLCVGKKHRDFDYNHPPGEINFWLPFTKVFDTNGVMVETEPEKGDYHCLEMDYGQIFRFYGNKCWHYSEVNTTGCTRVSIDFRVIPESKWDYINVDAEATSVKSKMKFVIGGYYDICTAQPEALM